MILRKSALSIAVFAWCVVWTGPVFAEQPQGVVKSGSEKRALWTTSRISGSPEAPLPFVTEPAFPALKFNQCLDITKAPGSDRLFVVEQSGKILSFRNQPDVKSADLVVDLAKAIPGVKETYALTFHPRFEQNRYCYVCYIMAPDLPDGSHIARFEVTKSDPPTIDVKTETTIITWLSGGHNGCDLAFGPDGCLYISTGDGTGPNPPDARRAGQDVSDLLSSILRIDVDHQEENRNYRIPADNPLVELKGARGEIWAYGFRNPWRMSFDSKTGDLWVGDVGWELWELLDRVERGGNYGWSVMEGRQPTNTEWPRGPTPILPPTIDHPHSESSSITDGLTYYGSRLKELQGHHIYGDYDTGKIWGFRYADGKVVGHRELADTTHRIVGFGDDAAGELYLLDHTAGTIHRLTVNSQRDQPSTFPRKLSESGLFTSMKDLGPAPGVIPYSINAELWSDFAAAERQLGLPGNGIIQNKGNEWTFPKDSVAVKTLSLEMRPDEPTSRKRIETQILHFDGIDWQPYTYQWNDEQTDAVLIPAAGSEQVFDIPDPHAAGGIRRQTWRFASRAECQRCHNKWSGSVLAINTPQLNKSLQASDGSGSQLDLLVKLRLFDKPIPVENRPKLADPRDPSASIENRARAYLHANCAHCHRMHAGSSVLSKMHFDLPLDKTDMIGIRPTQGTFGIHSAQVIAPGDPYRSVLVYRMSKLGGGRMPHIGSSEIDRTGVQLIHNWVNQMARSEKESGHEAVTKLRAAETAALQRLVGSKNRDEQQKLLQELLSSTSGALMLLNALDHQGVPQTITDSASELASRMPDVAVRDLFERFLPPEKRVQRLGSAIRPEQILSLRGDAARGRQVFFDNAAVSCKNCHRIQQEGKELGPELTTIGKKLNRSQILESILEPSKLIDPKYVSQLAETKEGRLVTGLLVSKDDREVVLKDSQGQIMKLATQDIEQLVPIRQSLMPELLLRDMTAQQVADLLEYLTSLK